MQSDPRRTAVKKREILQVEETRSLAPAIDFFALMINLKRHFPNKMMVWRLKNLRTSLQKGPQKWIKTVDENLK